MKTLVINPVGTTKWDESDKRIYQSFASPETEIDVISLVEGPESLETEEAKNEAIPRIVNRALKLHERYDGLIVNCCLDPGVDKIRSLIKTPIMGPFQASLAIASVIGRKAGVITVSRAASMLKELVLKYEMENRVGSMRGIDISVPQIEVNKEHTLGLLKKEICEEIREGADVVVLGCTSLSGFVENLKEEIEIPVVNPVAAAIKLLEDIIQLRLSTGDKNARP